MIDRKATSMLANLAEAVKARRLKLLAELQTLKQVDRVAKLLGGILPSEAHKRHMSRAAKAAIAVAQRRRWRKWRQGKGERS